LPLTLVGDVDLPGNTTRFDYQDVDRELGHLVVAHMNDASVVILDLKDGAVLKVLPNIPTARGVVVASEASRIFVTSSPDQLVMIDSKALVEVGRATTGRGPDGVGWDPVHRIVGVSDQGDGAVSLLADAGNGARVQVPLGIGTGNVAFDEKRSAFWVTVVGRSAPNQLVMIDPVLGKKTTSIDLPGCDGAHGLRISADGRSAFVACEGNNAVARVELDGSHSIVTASTGDGPDVLSIDPGLGWLYVAAESGDLVVFDVGKPGLTTIDREHPGDHAHSVAVDPSTHRVFFPLMRGPKGSPAMRIMQPTGTGR
jgi:DNA-binding beta-propeller fold protein YncE